MITQQELDDWFLTHPEEVEEETPAEKMAREIDEFFPNGI
jgi:hypothetical protein